MRITQRAVELQVNLLRQVKFKHNARKLQKKIYTIYETSEHFENPKNIVNSSDIHARAYKV